MYELRYTWPDLLRDLGLNIPARLVEKWLLEENTLVLFSAIVTLLAAAKFSLIFYRNHLMSKNPPNIPVE